MGDRILHRTYQDHAAHGFSGAVLHDIESIHVLADPATDTRDHRCDPVVTEPLPRSSKFVRGYLDSDGRQVWVFEATRPARNVFCDRCRPEDESVDETPHRLDAEIERHEIIAESATDPLVASCAATTLEVLRYVRDGGRS